MFLVAVLVLLFLMYRFYTFRAEMVFIMTLLTPAMLLIGAYHLTGEYREAGIFLLIVGIFLLAVVMFMYRITARGVEKEFRSAYYKNLFIYGALRFLQTFCRMTIVFSFRISLVSKLMILPRSVISPISPTTVRSSIGSSSKSRPYTRFGSSELRLIGE